MSEDLAPPGGAPAGRPATIGDVARAAGVSRATVSRVVNGRTSRDTDVATRVRDAVARLGYVPSGAARSLSLGRTQTVAMVVPDLGNPMFQQILRGFNGAAAADGYQVLVSDSQEVAGTEARLVREARRRADAVVVCAPRMPAEELRDTLAGLGPAVAVNRAVGGAGAAGGAGDGAVPVVTVDYEGGIRAAAEHLLDLGHRRVAYLQGPPGSESNQARLRGLQALAAARPELDLVVLACGSTIDDGYQAWPDLEVSGATAVLAYNDIVALGLLGRLGELGVAVPERVSVVGFDDVVFSRFSTPSLTTMHVDQAAMGLAAWRQLRAMLAGDPTRDLTVFVPQLIVRQSTRALG